MPSKVTIHAELHCEECPTPLVDFTGYGDDIHTLIQLFDEAQQKYDAHGGLHLCTKCWEIALTKQNEAIEIERRIQQRGTFLKKWLKEDD